MSNSASRCFDARTQPCAHLREWLEKFCAETKTSAHNTWQLTLVLEELFTNSIKHGALRNTRSVRVSAEQHDGVLKLDWREPLAAVLASAASPSEGSGYRLMERMARAHRGSFTIAANNGELIAHLEVPVAL